MRRESGTGVCACVIGDLNAADERAAGRVRELKGAELRRNLTQAVSITAHLHSSNTDFQCLGHSH